MPGGGQREAPSIMRGATTTAEKSEIIGDKEKRIKRRIKENKAVPLLLLVTPVMSRGSVATLLLLLQQHI